MEWAIFGGAAVIACGLCLVSGACFLASGFIAYAVFERWYNTRLTLLRHDAFEAGRNAAIRERGEEILKQGGPQTPLQADDVVSYADNLSKMYPKDEELLKAVDHAMKIRKMVESE